MFLTLHHNNVRFHYGSKQWHYTFDQIDSLSLIRKKRSYHLEDGAFIVVTVLTNYCMFFSDLKDLYYIVPAILCYSIIIILRFHDSKEFIYYVLVRDIYDKETKIKIKNTDRETIRKQIEKYSNQKFKQLIQKSI